ncbi:N-acyl-D-amino-acid deacylase family protein [Desulfosarcina ovata]|uniref:Aminoacylase n=1 Tax=Desulfosarcina ovata subsp. ovata TaxID=2752305 RepID=A0A5K8AHQ9_9BACT|nr:D-aminoacylase [Desulfosarcina ovata]BBO92233.1 aminoacylase [Desulfosarcina ovata subsp. ovata]
MFDTIIKNGLVIDGTGAPACRADIGIKKGMIIDIAPSLDAAADEIIDAAGSAVTPGFIDIHTHSDFSLYLDPLAESKVFQGVTTEVTGNCGGSPAPVLADRRDDCMEYMASLGPVCVRTIPSSIWNWTTLDAFCDDLHAKGVAVNTVPLVGHSTLRSNVMGYDNRVPAPDEMKKMTRLLEIELEKGAFGLSTGLIYHPGAFATVDELSALAAVVADADGMYSTHMRSEGRFLWPAVEEALAVAARSGVSLEISHLKCESPERWGSAGRLLQQIDEARQTGLRIDFDQYPYTAYNSGMLELFPTWAKENGTRKMIAVLNDPEQRKAVVADMTTACADWENPMDGLGWDQILLTGYVTAQNRSLNGLSVADMAEKRGQPPLDAALDVFVEEAGGLGMIVFSMHENDLITILKHPDGMIGSDGRAVSPSGPFSASPVHPRFYGTFPRVLGRYVREKQVLSLETAVRKMTGLPARKLGLKRRGLLRAGMAADIVIFDPQTITDNATFEAPHRLASGISHVLVNGQTVIDNGRHTGCLPGRRLRRGE